MNISRDLKRTASCVSLLALIFLSLGCSAWFGQQRSPFSGLTPKTTPLVVEGTPQDVLKFLRQLEITIPELGEGLDIGSLQCDRLLYAAVPPDNHGDFTACKKTLMRTVNAIEETWTQQQFYPAPDAVTLPQCPYGGQFSYESDGRQFTLSCSGPEHQMHYSSLKGLSSHTVNKSPLIFIAFKSGDPRWQDAAISKKHPEIKILTSDPERTLAFLEQDEENLEIRYPKHTSLYANVLNERLSDFWDSLPLTLPGERSIITKNAQSGVYSLRAGQPSAEPTPGPDLPAADRCWQQLPPGATRLAASCELLKQLNLLPWPLKSAEKSQPQIFGIATNDVCRLNKFMPTVNSAFSGLSEAGLIAQFTDSSSAQQGLQNSPWGDLSKSKNPHCVGEQRGNTVSVTIGEKLKGSDDSAPPLLKGPGPLQLTGRLTVIDYTNTSRSYLISGGLHKGELWLEVKPNN